MSEKTTEQKRFPRRSVILAVVPTLLVACASPEGGRVSVLSPRGVTSDQSDQVHARCANAATEAGGANFDIYAGCMQRFGYVVKALDAHGNQLEDWQRPHPYWVNLYPLTFTSAPSSSSSFPQASTLGAPPIAPVQPALPIPYQPPVVASESKPYSYQPSATTYQQAPSQYRAPKVASQAIPPVTRYQPSATVGQPPAPVAPVARVQPAPQPQPQSQPPASLDINASQSAQTPSKSDDAGITDVKAVDERVPYPKSLQSFTAGARLWQVIHEHQRLILKIAHPTGRLEPTSLLEPTPMRTDASSMKFVDHLRWHDLFGREFETILIFEIRTSNFYSIESLSVNVEETNNPIPAAFHTTEASKKVAVRLMQSWLKSRKTTTATALQYTLVGLNEAVTVKNVFETALRYAANNT